jgi:hypothetical protein
LTELNAQEDSSAEDSRTLEIRSDIQGGIVMGGQVVNEKFIYKPGVMGQFSLNAQISPKVYAGIGVSMLSLEDETILPVYLDLKAFFNEGAQSSFIGLNVGASVAWSDYYRNVAEFEYEGGLYFSPYYSFQFPLSDDINFLVVTGLVHHIGEIEFITEFDEEYEERFAMDFLTIRAGIRF